MKKESPGPIRLHSPSLSNPQVAGDHYDFDAYVDLKRWSSYWYQVKEVTAVATDPVLEIGTGNGLLKSVLTGLGRRVATVDIDASLGPDFVGSVLDLPFSDGEYPVVAAFQILEHLPFDRFEDALRELKRVSRCHVLISLPDAWPRWNYAFYLPKFGEVQVSVPRPRLRAQEHRFDGQHYWEISKRGFDLGTILQSFRSARLDVIRRYRIPENPYHHFFVCNV